MPPLKAKVRAYDQVYDGEVVADKRKRALIQYRISKKGKLHTTMFTKCMTEGDFAISEKNGVCYIEGTEAKAAPVKVKLKADPDAMPLRKAAPSDYYSEGSIREQRLALLTQVDAISKEIRACVACRILREKRNILMEQADGLLIGTATEADNEHGTRKVRKIVIKPEVEGADAE
jgi:hypothetical protein